MFQEDVSGRPSGKEHEAGYTKYSSLILKADHIGRLFDRSEACQVNGSAQKHVKYRRRTTIWGFMLESIIRILLIATVPKGVQIRIVLACAFGFVSIDGLQPSLSDSCR